MTWLAQVRHVFVKDLREVRWFLLAYIAIVGLATARASGWSSLTVPWLEGVSLLVVIAGLVLIALVVQADSPIRSDAFWLAHPLHPAAVLGAKAVFALLLIAIGIIGQAIALRFYDIGAPAVPRLLARPATLYAAWLLGAMLVAAMLRDLRSFALAVVTVPLAFLLFRLLLAHALSWPASPIPALILELDVLAVLLGLGTLAWFYRTRDARRRARAAGLLVAVVALTTLGMRAPARLEDTDDGGMPSVPLALELPEGISTAGSYLRLQVRADTLPDHLRVALTDIGIELRLRDGTVVRLRPRMSHVIGGQSVPREPRLQWLERRAPQFPMSLSVTLTPDQRRLVERGISGVTLEGRVMISEAVAVATMELIPGNDTAVAGHRARIEDWSNEFGEPTVRLWTSSVPVQPRAREYVDLWQPRVQPVLVNPARGEAYRLAGAGATSGPGAAVLPGLGGNAWSGDFGLIQSAPARNPLDSAWLSQARLLLVTHEFRASYPVRLEVRVP